MSNRLSFRKALTRILLPGLVLLIILWACNAPSFPLPPPQPEAFVFEQTGQAQVVLTIEQNDRIMPNARVTVENLKLNVWVGGLAGPNGEFTSMPFTAEDGDIVQVSFEDPDNEDRGGSTCLIVGNYGGVPAADPRCGDYQ